jgi:hypothetical protein
MNSSQSNNVTMDMFYEVRYLAALQTAKNLNAQGEYIWASHWRNYAKQLVAANTDYQDACNRARRRQGQGPVGPQGQHGRQEESMPLPRVPLQPSNLANVETNGEVVRYQCTSAVCKRPKQFQGVRV